MELTLEEIASIKESVEDYLLGEGPKPPDWDLFLACRRWRVLPNAGGMLDQEYELIIRFELYEQALASSQRVQQFLSSPPPREGGL